MAWWLLWRLTHRLSMMTIDDHESVSTVVRRLAKPLVALLILFLAHKAMIPYVMPLFGRIGERVYPWLWAMTNVGAASWFTLVWVSNTGVLLRWCERRPAGSSNGRGSGDPGVSDANGRGEGFGEKTMILQPALSSRLGRYQIVRELGRGSMGVVYLGKDPTLQRMVAIKTMRLDLDDPDHVKEIKERFFREAESTGRLAHPNIITVYDAGEQAGLGYIAMEYLEGTTLNAWCRKDHLLPVTRALEIIALVGDALDYAHERGVVHRDIKPANIMVTSDSAVKVMDFGVARLNTATTSQTTVILGTPNYMSPEQLAGEAVDGRSDVFSLGVVLFELLTSEKPFEADTMASLLFKIAHEPHRSLRSLRSDLTAPMEAIVDRALQKDVARRYPRARDFAKDLRDCVKSGSV